MSTTEENTGEPRHRGWHSRGYLPHFDAPRRYQAITFRLADSMPQCVLDEWERELEALADEDERDQERSRRVERYLDAGHGLCLLREAKSAEITENALLRFDGERYRLLAWCVMPNHVHALLQCLPGFPLGEVMHSWKSFTAHGINAIHGRTGQVWQRDYYDRFMRDEEHYWNTVRYIERNPVKARLVKEKEEWLWSSARYERIWP
jgi:REP element-mobilizing transposase RayT